MFWLNVCFRIENSSLPIVQLCDLLYCVSSTFLKRTVSWRIIFVLQPYVSMYMYYVCCKSNNFLILARWLTWMVCGSRVENLCFISIESDGHFLVLQASMDHRYSVLSPTKLVIDVFECTGHISQNYPCCFFFGDTGFEC